MNAVAQTSLFLKPKAPPAFIDLEARTEREAHLHGTNHRFHPVIPVLNQSFMAQ